MSLKKKVVIDVTKLDRRLVLLTFLEICEIMCSYNGTDIVPIVVPGNCCPTLLIYLRWLLCDTDSNILSLLPVGIGFLSLFSSVLNSV